MKRLMKQFKIIQNLQKNCYCLKPMTKYTILTRNKISSQTYNQNVYIFLVLSRQTFANGNNQEKRFAFFFKFIKKIKISGALKIKEYTT